MQVFSLYTVQCKGLNLKEFMVFKRFICSGGLLLAISPFAAQAQTQTPEKQSSAVSMVIADKNVYMQKCTFCHAPKSSAALPDMQAWIRLLYTSACPQVSLSLTEPERQSIKRYFALQFKTEQK